MQTSDEVEAYKEKMGQSNVHVKVDMEKTLAINTTEKVGGVTIAKETSIENISADARPWSELQIDIVRLITTRLAPVAYARMRSICNSW